MKERSHLSLTHSCSFINPIYTLQKKVDANRLINDVERILLKEMAFQMRLKRVKGINCSPEYICSVPNRLVDDMILIMISTGLRNRPRIILEAQNRKKRRQKHRQEFKNK
jgi:hypothetical protein